MIEEHLKKEAEQLAESKFKEMVFNQKIEELNKAITEMTNQIPSALQELRKALELLDKEDHNFKNATSKNIEKIYAELLQVKKDLDGLFVKIRDIFI